MNPIKQNKQSLKSARSAIQDFQNECDSIFEELCLELGVKEEDPIKDNIFDYVYNGFGSLRELEKIWNRENGNSKLPYKPETKWTKFGDAYDEDYFDVEDDRYTEDFMDVVAVGPKVYRDGNGKVIKKK